MKVEIFMGSPTDNNLVMEAAKIKPGASQNPTGMNSWALRWGWAILRLSRRIGALESQDLQIFLFENAMGLEWS